MARAAVVVGIDHYQSGNNLTGCVNDAAAIATLLHRNSDDSVNFECQSLTSSATAFIKTGELRAQIRTLFSNKDIEIALFYFAGHGRLDNGTGYLCASDSSRDNLGLPFEEVLGCANRSPARHKFIILDCCHAGAIRDLLGAPQLAPLAEGVAVLAACRDDQYAAEKGGRGLVTSHLCNAFAGGGADVQGTVTIASLYAYVDDMLSALVQRPLFLASLAKFAPLRRAKPAISDEKLRNLPQFFPTADAEFQLDPSFEPEHPSKTAANTQKFALLQQLRAARLVEPVGAEHMYFAAIESKTCKLTPLGKFYWQKAFEGRI